MRKWGGSSWGKKTKNATQKKKEASHMKKQLSEMEDKMKTYNIHLRFLDCENREGINIFGKHITDNV